MIYYAGIQTVCLPALATHITHIPQSVSLSGVTVNGPFMRPGDKFDASRLVKPGEWDSPAGEGDAEAQKELEAQMAKEFEEMKAAVMAEKNEKAKKGAAVTKPQD